MRPAAMLLLLAACAAPPETPPVTAAASAGPWPRILPVEALGPGTALRLEGADRAALLRRAATLRARAAALRGPVVGADDRARLVRPRVG